MFLKVALVLAAYLLGSIPFGFLLVKYVFTEGEDVRKIGSGGIGATNVTRRAGRTAGLLTYLLDLGKGFAAVWLMRSLAGDDYLWMGAAGVAAMLGHSFPVYLRFRGGKGVATGAGMFLALAPYAILAAMVVWAVVVYISRYVSLGSIIASATIPIWLFVFYGWLDPSPHLTELVIIGIGGAAVVISRHHENIARLMSGTESRIGQRVRQGRTGS